VFACSKTTPFATTSAQPWTWHATFDHATVRASGQLSENAMKSQFSVPTEHLP
jgi:hypothetical protein